MKFSIFLYKITAVFLLSFLLGKSSAWADREKSICIIGAGASGISAAAELAEMGYGIGEQKIKMFESKLRIGGKCNSVASGPDVFEMGAVLAAPTYKWVRYFADKVGHPLVPHATIAALTRCGESYQVEDIADHYGIPSLSNPLNFIENCKIFKEIHRYNGLANKVMRDDETIDYESLSEEFYDADEQGNKQLKSFATFAREQDLNRVSPWFELFVNSFGYLTLDEIPALYVIDYIGNLGGYWAYLKGFATSRRLHSGYEVLLAEIFGHFYKNIDLTLGATVKKIDRANQTLTYEKDGQDYEEACTHFIIATEPGHVINILDEPSQLERLMRDSVAYSPYRTLVVSSNIPRGAFTLPHESKAYRPGEVVLIANDYQEGQDGMLKTLLYTVEDDQTIHRSTQEVLAAIREQMARYGLSVGNIVKDDQGRDMHRTWPNYFPHFKTYILDQIEREQGRRNTYYVGPAYHGFELVERSMAHGAKIVHTYFADQDHPVPSENRFDSHKSIIGVPDWSGESDKAPFEIN